MDIQNQLNEIDAVKTVMQKYIDGAAGNPDLLTDAFHRDARMFGHFGDERRDVPISTFIALVSSPPGPLNGPSYRAEIVSVDVTGLMGRATLIEEDYRGFDFVNYFTFSKIKEDWKIVSKTFTSTSR